MERTKEQVASEDRHHRIAAEKQLTTWALEILTKHNDEDEALSPKRTKMILPKFYNFSLLYGLLSTPQREILVDKIMNPSLHINYPRGGSQQSYQLEKFNLVEAKASEQT